MSTGAEHGREKLGRQVRIALVEDKPDVRDSWVALINSFPDLHCVCTCATGEEALKVIPAHQPDVVLMDIFLPRMSGIECTALLKERLPKTRIIMLTGVDDEELVFPALEAGADGYLLKRIKPEQLHQALLDVVSGGAPMTSEIARRLVEYFRNRAHHRAQAVRLTAREEEILLLLTRGYANKEIAERIGISVDTVRSHLKHIYEKLHVRSRAEAVAKYMGARDR